MLTKTQIREILDTHFVKKSHPKQRDRTWTEVIPHCAAPYSQLAKNIVEYLGSINLEADKQLVEEVVREIWDEWRKGFE